ncbi:MAG: glycosyltransferase [Bacteroidetes bacterium]|nr:glycosyltransferase [Bacteroidota bacterium]
MLKLLKKRNKLVMNIVTLNREEKLTRLLSKCADVFDEIRVCDGGSTDDTLKVCKRYSCKIIENEWEDNFSIQHNLLLDMASPGDRIFILDDDEYLSEQLMQIIPSLTFEEYNQLEIPNIMVINNIQQFKSVDEFIRLVKDEGHEQFCKTLYIKYEHGIRMEGASHCGLTGIDWRRKRIIAPIIHDKSSIDMIWGNIYKAIIDPQANGYTEEEGKRFLTACHKESIYTSKQLENYLEGPISDELKQLFIEWQHPDHNEKRKLFQYYFLIKQPTEFLTYRKDIFPATIIAHIRDMSGYNAISWWENGCEYLSTADINPVLQSFYGPRYNIEIDSNITENTQDHSSWWNSDEIVEIETMSDDFNPEDDKHMDIINEIANWADKNRLPNDARILEIGSGGGRMQSFWNVYKKRANKSFVIEGVEHAEKLIEGAKKILPETMFYNIDAKDMSFVRQYDAIYTCVMLQHNSLWKVKLILANIYRALKPNGLFWMVHEETVSANVQNPYQQSDRGNTGTATWWVRLVANYGFQLLHFEGGTYTWRKI